MNLFEESGAEFSPCRKYRYALWRIWDPEAPLAMFIGLNPSTANEVKADPTIMRVSSMVRSWGYGGFYMMNLFALVSPYPDDLKKVADPLGDNDGWIERISQKCQLVVFCWGNFKEAKVRAKAIIDLFPDAHALYINKDGSPKHPLYCPIKTLPIKFQNHHP
jgi:hypothetical protein